MEKTHEQAFLKLKQELMLGPTITCPDYIKMFIFQTEASERGIGAVFSQQVDSEYRPIAFLLQETLPHETNYTTTEKECLAIINAVQHFSV